MSEYYTPDEIQENIRSREKSMSFFSNSGKPKREIWVVAEFLRNLGIIFEDSELKAGNDPPDVVFQNAAFEIKEVDEGNRRRGDEYKEKLKKAKTAISPKYLMTPYKSKEIVLSEVINRIHEALKGFIYDKGFCKKIDILFYINYSLIGEHNYTIFENAVWAKWRSVSMVTNNNISCVFFANDDAPEFIKAIEGEVINRNIG